MHILPKDLCGKGPDVYAYYLDLAMAILRLQSQIMNGR
jgi:hypothetical protein